MLWGYTAVEHLAELVLAGYIHPEPGIACSIDKTQSLIGLACEKHLSVHAVGSACIEQLLGIVAQRRGIQHVHRRTVARG